MNLSKLIWESNVTIYRVQLILREDGYQATQTMWEWVEILVATLAAIALAIGMFVQDTGVKEEHFWYRGYPKIGLKNRRYNPTVVHRRILGLAMTQMGRRKGKGRDH